MERLLGQECRASISVKRLRWACWIKIWHKVNFKSKHCRCTCEIPIFSCVYREISPFCSPVCSQLQAELQQKCFAFCFCLCTSWQWLLSATCTEQSTLRGPLPTLSDLSSPSKARLIKRFTCMERGACFLFSLAGSQLSLRDCQPLLCLYFYCAGMEHSWALYGNLLAWHLVTLKESQSTT